MVGLEPHNANSNVNPISCLPLQHYISLHKGMSRRQYNCQKCRYNFSDLTLLERHWKNHHQKDLEYLSKCHIFPLKCHICEETFILEEALHYHQKVDHSHDIKSFECENCERKYFCKGAFQVHKSIAHSGWKPHNANPNNAHFISCQQESIEDLILCQFCCDSAFSVPEIVRHHKDFHELQALPYFLCEVDNCEFYSKKLSETGEHMKNLHNTNEYKPYQCRHCDYKIGIGKSIQASAGLASAKFAKHMLIHAQEKKHYKCDICNKKVQNLQRHQRSQHGKDKDKKCVCETCGFVAKHKDMLKRHIRSVHKRDLKCPYCDKVYGRNEILQSHIEKSHPGTSDLKFFCSKCGKGFMFRCTYGQHDWKCQNEKNIAKIKSYYVAKSQSKRLGANAHSNKEEEKETPGKEYPPEEDRPCKYCGKEYNKKGMQYHLSNEHFDEHYKDCKKMEYNCSVCEEKYLKKESKFHFEYFAH